MLLFYYPLTRFGSLLIDQYHSVRIWFITLPVTFSFTLINLFFVPEYYETYYVHNAVTACASVPREKRRISLSIACLFEKELYIAATNSFDGKVSMKDGTYLSTKQDETYPSTKSDGVYLPAKKGVHGIGLRSIQTTAEHYGGRATFHHDVENFYSDIMLPLK